MADKEDPAALRAKALIPDHVGAFGRGEDELRRVQGYVALERLELERREIAEGVMKLHDPRQVVAKPDAHALHPRLGRARPRLDELEAVAAPASVTSKFFSSALSPESSAAGLCPSDTSCLCMITWFKSLS